MLVRLEILFDSPTADDAEKLTAVARGLTNERRSVRVFPRQGAPDCLVAEFTMPDEAQYRAVPKIDRALRFSLWNRVDTTIAFPKSEEERERARRKAQRRARRRGKA